MEKARLPFLPFPVWPGGRKHVAMYLSSPCFFFFMAERRRLKFKTWIKL